MLDLNAIDAQYKPLEDLEPQLKAARKTWAQAVNLLDAATSQLQIDKQRLALVLPKIQVGVFSTTNTNDIAEFLADQLAVNADDAKIGPLQAAVDSAFEAWNGLYAKWQTANSALTQNPGQIERTS